MPRVDVTQLVQDISNSQADSTAVERYYDDIVDELGRGEILTNASLVAQTEGTATYSTPAEAIKLLAVVYDDAMLSREKRENLDAVNGEWRTERGRPIAFTPEGEDTHDFRLYPTPDVDSHNFIPVFGQPVGADYPTYSAMAIYTERRDDLPLWLEFPVVFEILSREFSRPSNHTDARFAAMCKRLANVLFKMVIKDT